MLTYTADGCQEIAAIEPTGCCPPPLCGNALCCTLVAFFGLLPSGPLWDFWKAAAISYFEQNPNPDPATCPLIQDPACPSLVLHAIYCAFKLKRMINNALWPSYRESNPVTAVTTVDFWLTQMRWEDCFLSYCRSAALGQLSPYEINSDCGPLFCPPNFSQELSDAMKHNILRALTRAQMGGVKNLCWLNWVIEPLGAALEPTTPQTSNPNPPIPDALQCQSGCPDGVAFTLCRTSDTLEAIPVTDLCDTLRPPAQVPGNWDWGCDRPIGLPEEVWPGVLAAECIVRSLLPVPCTIIRREDCLKCDAIN